MKTNNGFTLIELLVVIAILGLLAALTVFGTQGVFKQARDAQRISDFRSIQIALRTYYSDFGRWPASGSGDSLIGGCVNPEPGGAICAGSCSGGGGWRCIGKIYMESVPRDPLSPNQEYSYAQTPAGYDLTTCLENTANDKCVVSESCSSGCAYVVTQ